DLADGHLARRRQEVTEMGKFLDPLADKLLMISVLIGLVQLDLLAAWVVVVIFCRELLITALRALRFEHGVVAASTLGKAKTASQSGAVLLLLLSPPYPALYLPGELVMAIAVFLTLVSGADYLWRFRHFWLGREPTGAAAMADFDPLVEQIGTALIAAGRSVAVAESCTGGLLAAALTEVPGSSRWFIGGVVAYSERLKRELLGVSEAVLESCGAVSAEAAREMAEGVRKRVRSDIGLSITGLAGPTSDESDKPVGLIHLWLDGVGGGEGRQLQLSGDRVRNRQRAVSEALALLLEHVVSSTQANVRSA
ncbi:MAG: CDP-diacylglycerol--glycerol-3-phosphate 3-phosphatidyltransferase, partial [Candidatus Dormibacteraceae bacterium]